jgi:hypothetical protein
VQHPNDMKNLLAWRRLLDETFQTNLAIGAKVKAKNGVGRSTFGMATRATE